MLQSLLGLCHTLSDFCNRRPPSFSFLCQLFRFGFGLPFGFLSGGKLLGFFRFLLLLKFGCWVQLFDILLSSLNVSMILSPSSSPSSSCCGVLPARDLIHSRPAVGPGRGSRS